MGFDDRLWIHLVEQHDAHQVTGPEPPSRHRRPMARGGVTAGVVLLAVTAAGALVLAKPSGESAWAKQVIQRAADALTPTPSPGTILHVVATQTVSPRGLRDGPSVAFLSEEGWLQQGPPWRRRVIVHPAGGPILEQGNDGRIFNMTSNQLYPGPQIPSGMPHYTLIPTGHAGSFRLRVRLPHGGIYTQIFDAGTVKALHDGTQTVSWAVTWNGHVQQLRPLVTPSGREMQVIPAQQPAASSLAFASQLHGLLASGHARVARTTTSDGKPAIKISSDHPQSGPRTNYYVNPTTYSPIEVDTYGYESPADVTRVRFSVYQTVSLAGHQRLLTFAVPPTARTDRNAADYYRWQVRTPF